MFITNTKISALAVSLALLASCTKNTYQTEAGHGDVLSDAETSLSYDKNALAANVSVENSPIAFDRLGSTSLLGLVKLTKLASLTGQQAVAGYTPSATGEEIEGGGNYTVNSSTDVLVVPAGKTFSGQINFNAAGKLIVLGTFTGSTSLPNKGTLEIGNEAVFTPSGFNVNGSAAVVNNYGTVVLNSGSIQGKWTNYAQVTFKSNTSLNSVMQFDNYCKVVFEGRVNINSLYKNWSYMVFQEGFQLNGQGQLQNHDGAYTEVNGGTIGIDGEIVGGTSAYSRLDISNTTINNLNANLAVTGKIDINFTNADETRFAGKTGADVTIGQDVYIAAAGCTPAKGSGGCDDSALSFTLLATVTSPEVNDALLSATDVRIADGHAYVSYHTNDEVYGNTPGGAIRIFDVQNPSALSLISEALFTNMEFNGVEANDTKLYAAGQNKAGALLLTAPLNNGNLAVNDLSQFTKHKLPAASAKNTVSYNNQLWVVSGAANGGFFALDPQNGYQVAQNLYTSTRAKYSANNATHQAFFAAESDKAYLRVAKLDGSDVKEYTFPALTQQIVDGKNVLVLDDLYAYIALSDRGVAKIDLATGELKAHFVPNDFRKDGKKVFRDNGYTNAVAVDGCYLYLANGADGVIVLNKNTFQVVGKFNLPESTNFVAAKSGLLFVATGRNGLNIIKIN
ncbi:LVIVD repeat-containing protein [Sphingobacterium lumbrici]|uniref:hypothetical protein n=1 Tax=Sphingobacterium lumbrici TaxID=2559600 RepID=UPI00112EBB6A|nr:hypothetical protein [Sphingobacterium lumbrici]